MKLFQEQTHDSAAQKALAVIRDSKANQDNWRNNPTYVQANEALWLINSIEEGAHYHWSIKPNGNPQEGVIFASANNNVHQWKLTHLTDEAYNNIKAVNPDVVLLRDHLGRWTDYTEHFQ